MTTQRNILVLSDSLHELPAAVAALEGCGHSVHFVNSLTPIAELAAEGTVELAQVDALVTGRVMGLDAAALDLMRRLKVVALHTSGSDNIDLDAARTRRIAVCTVKGVNAEQCAEFSIGLMLAVTRQIRTGDIAIRAGEWAARTQSSIDLYGATLGVFGLGLIGKAAVRRAAAFGVKILAHTRTQDHAFAEQYGVEFVDKDMLLASADIVSLYTSLSPQTHHMIGERELRLMQKHAYLINIARGELIDEAALYRALTEGWIAGAGLDVFETEPLYDSPFFALDNVVLTPHQAGLANSAKSNAALGAVTNALDALAGQRPQGCINPEIYLNEANA